ncbi:MAG: LON peptidase substrate-binding domain-containing protein [Myxococcaceae bacterium]
MSDGRVELPVVTAEFPLFPVAFIGQRPDGANGRAIAAALAANREVWVVLSPELDAMAVLQQPGLIGTIAWVGELDAGRYVLRGIRRARLEGVGRLSPCAHAEVSPLTEPEGDDSLRAVTKRLLKRFRQRAPASYGGFSRWLESLPIPDDVVNLLAGNSGFSPQNQQALLELPGPDARATRIAELLEGPLVFQLAPPLVAGGWWLLGVKLWLQSPERWWFWASVSIALALGLTFAIIWFF